MRFCYLFPFVALSIVMLMAGCDEPRQNIGETEVSEPASPTPESTPESTPDSTSESNPSAPKDSESSESTSGAEASAEPKVQTAIFGGGCFWCTEAVFQRLKGVEKVESGYSGGTVENPTYEDICTGTTGHAEVIRITFDSGVVSYDELLEVFFMTHDPTTLNQQGNDKGTQYRSVVFYLSDQQKQQAEQRKKQLDESGAFDDPIVTFIQPAPKFYKAEGYHQNYFNLNPNQGYCRAIIVPKIEKFKKVFAEKLK